MTYDIRPLTFGEVLERALQVYLDHFGVLFGISALVLVPGGILLASAALIGNVAAVILNFLFIAIAAPLMQAALTIAVAEVYLGRPATIEAAYRSTRSIFKPLVETYLLLGLLLIVPCVMAGVTFFLSWRLLVISMAAALGITFYYIGCWSLVGPVIIIERRFRMSALRRSAELISGSWWRTFAILLVAGLLANLPALALSYLWSYVPVFGVILNAVTEAISTTYGSVALMIYYFDRRRRSEGFDLHHLGEQVLIYSAPATAPGSSSYG